MDNIYMHNHRTSCCIVLHKFTAFLARKIKKILSTTASSGGNRIFFFFLPSKKVVSLQLIDRAHIWDRLSFNNYRNVLKLAV